MMTLSQKGRYALRALYLLAADGSGHRSTTEALSRRGNIPRKFLELILVDLRNAGVLHSKKGKGGGYTLARDPSDIRLGEIIRITDGPFIALPCARDSGADQCEECDGHSACGTRMVMRQVTDAVARIVDGTSLAGALGRRNRSNAAR